MMIKFTRFSVLALVTVISLLAAKSNTWAQSPTERLITTLPVVNGYIDAYSLKYDEKTGNWAFFSYDTLAAKYSVITKNGASRQFNFVSQYSSLFDDEGNIYSIATSTVNDSTSEYFILKNTEVISQAFSYVNEGWAINSGVIYFAAADNKNQYLASIDTKTNVVTKGKLYDEIRLVYTVSDGYSEGEDPSYVGFTKSGKPYYVAVENNMAFMVIGTEEGKRYSDINYFGTVMDANDVPAYIVKDAGKFFETRGNTFVVHGSKEFKKFDWIYGPIIFDGSGNPVYVGQDSVGDYKYRSTIMQGNTALKTINGSIYTYLIAPNGKLLYIPVVDDQTKKGEQVSYSTVVFDGKESKKYSSIGEVKFTENSVPMYVAYDYKGKSMVVKGDEVVTEKYDNIFSYGYTPSGSFNYVGTNYGSYEKKTPDKNFVYIDGEKKGPFELINTTGWQSNSAILTGKDGSYAFIAGKIKDKNNYYYKYRAYGSGWESKEYDMIQDLTLFNNKVIYFAGNQLKKDVYVYDLNMYIDNKKTGESYSSVTDIEINDQGVLSFMASRGNNIYWVEVKP